ncbi:MAG TPA: MaoC family dehydratase [Dehalococcoidia bacterium]|nr:MaoC family dehydratase [Dehalococcoidia bacterium]
MAQETLVTDEVKAIIGVETVGPPELIEMKAIKDYAKAINWPDPPNPLHVDEEYAKKSRHGSIIAPWSFYTSLGRGVPRQRVPLPPARVGMNGGNDYEYFLPIRPGDVITTTSKIVDIVEREGRAGKLIITTSERKFTNQNGEVVGIARGTGLSQY